jgi:hypothetical protein
MLNYEDHLNHLLKNREGINVHSIHFVKHSVLNKEPKEQLEAISLNKLQPVFFSIDGEGYCDKGMLNSNGSDVQGCVLNVIISGAVSQIILIQSDVRRKPELTLKQQKTWDCIMQLSALAHELGHVEDMQKKNGSNFLFGEQPTVDLVKAEAYAHAFSLNYLKKIGSTVGLPIIAKSLYKLHAANKPFEKELYLSLCLLVGKGRLKNWANA